MQDFPLYWTCNFIVISRQLLLISGHIMILRTYKVLNGSMHMLVRSLAVLLVSVTTNSSVASEEITGDFGYRLGGKLEARYIEQKIADENRTTTFRVKHLTGDPYYQTILVTVASNDKITDITARGPLLTMGVCGKHQQDKLKDLQKQYPAWNYYAAGDADLLYKDEYSILLGCEESGDSRYLKLEYTLDMKTEGSDR